jgi:hypothetical protein
MANLKRRVEELERRQLAPGASYSAQFDDDALTIYRGMPYLDGTTVPSYDKVQPTEIYARGRELHEKRYGRIIPAHLDPHLKRCTLASAEFEFVFEREPEAGDLLRFEHVGALHSPHVKAFYFCEFIAAWERQLSHLDCPLRFEEGALFKRSMPERRMQDARWVQDSSIASDEKWWGIECAFNWSLGESTLVADTGMAIVFLGLSAANGKHRCRPATKEEMIAPETDEFKQLCNSGVTHEQMSAKHWRLKTHEVLITVFGE